MKRQTSKLLVLDLLGLVAVALLWYPFDHDASYSFSGPTRSMHTYGLLSAVSVGTEYESRRVALRSLSGHRSEPPDLPKRLGEYPSFHEMGDQPFI